MKFWFPIAVAIPMCAAAQLLGVNEQFDRVYSETTVTNRAWRRDVVTVRNGVLSDPTGTLVSKADVEFLIGVESAISDIYAAGSNGFQLAKAEFEQAVEDNPPQSATHLAMVFPPYSPVPAEDRNPYMYLVEENVNSTTNELKWFFSQPFLLKPRVIAQDIYITEDGVVTNYNECTFVDYYNDATNTPVSCGEYPRVIRMVPPPIPDDATVLNSHHMQFGHPSAGLNFGSMGIGVRQPGSQEVKYGITGTYTDTVNSVEWTFDHGACKGVKHL